MLLVWLGLGGWWFMAKSSDALAFYSDRKDGQIVSPSTLEDTTLRQIVSL